MKKLLLALVLGVGSALAGPVAAQAQPCSTCQVVGQDIGQWVAGLNSGKLSPSYFPAATNSVAGVMTLVTAGAQAPIQTVGSTLQLSGTQVNLFPELGAGAGTFSNITVDTYGRITAIRTINSGDVTTALGFTPYNATNPSGYITSSALTPYAPLASPALTGTPTAPTAAAGTNTTQIATTGNVVSTIEAPPAAGYGATTAEPVHATTIGATGAITPSGGITGSTTGTSPASGYVGQVITAASTGLSLAAGTATNLTSVSLTPGNYICMGGFTVGTTGSLDSLIVTGLTTTSQSIANFVQPAEATLNAGSPIFQSGQVIPAGSASVLVTSTETLYLVGYSNIATTSSGGSMSCVRIQ